MCEEAAFVDSFSGITLHLSFTDCEFPIDLGTRGLRDTQAVMLEAVISSNDRGKDLGDIVILYKFENEFVEIVRGTYCTHGVSLASAHALTKLDCWDELLQSPSTTTGIVRAFGNWQARIAAAAVCHQMGQKVLVLPKKKKTVLAVHCDTDLIQN